MRFSVSPIACRRDRAIHLLRTVKHQLRKDHVQHIMHRMSTPKPIAVKFGRIDRVVRISLPAKLHPECSACDVSVHNNRDFIQLILFLFWSSCLRSASTTVLESVPHQSALFGPRSRSYNFGVSITCLAPWANLSKSKTLKLCGLNRDFHLRRSSVYLRTGSTNK